MSILSGLNSEQYDAVKATEGAVLILAGAGSGKTRVITTRIAHILQEKKAKPEQILAVTFTNKAAKEMAERVRSIVKGDTSKLQISTFHSYGLRMLKKHIHLLGYKKSFSICDETTRLGIIKNGIKSLTKEVDKFDPNALLNKISNAKNRLTTMDWSGEDIHFMPSLLEFYNERLKINNLVDFDDLLLLPVHLLEQNPDLQLSIANGHKYVMVDEYQDTNSIQDKLLSFVSGYHKNICVVGDDDQSIYGWRGAETENILSFHTRWRNCKVITLEQNYRSTSTILNAANAVIKNNTVRKAKSLWSQLGEGELINYYLAESDRSEAEFVAQRIAAYINQRKYKQGDVAILYRRNTQSRVIEEQLRMNGVYYKLVGGYKFYDRKEIKDILSYMRFIANPDDELALERIINIPNRGIGSSTFDKLSRFAHLKKISVFSAIKSAFTLTGISNDKKMLLHEFHELITLYRLKYETENIGEATKALLNQVHYKQYLKKFSKTDEEFQAKIEIVQEFIQSMYDYSEKNSAPSLQKYLDKIMLLEQDTNDDENRDLVSVMSIHASKGLEFPVVFVIGMEEGIFPSSRSMEENDDVSEERRLAYVAITRAKEKLFLSSVKERKRYNETVYPDLSRFLIEIPSVYFTTPPASFNDEEQVEKRTETAAANFFNLLDQLKKNSSN
jgi:DNA helicase-2/ATP-dependent DNA helicase PcrA